MKNAASCETWCELQDTLSTNFLNAHCAFGFRPEARLSEGRIRLTEEGWDLHYRDAVRVAFREFRYLSIDRADFTVAGLKSPSILVLSKKRCRSACPSGRRRRIFLCDDGPACDAKNDDEILKCD